MKICRFCMGDQYLFPQIISKQGGTCTVEPRLSGPRLSGLFDYPDFFAGPVFFFMNFNKL